MAQKICIYKLWLLIFALAVFLSGCMLPKEGTGVFTYCHTTPPFLYDVEDPCFNSYKIQGYCETDGWMFATYDISATWRKEDGKGSSIIIVNYREYEGQEFKYGEGYVTADCPGGDPLLYNVQCVNRKFHGSMFTIIPGSDSIFMTSPFPQVLDEGTKATLRNLDQQWLQQPPKIKLPKPGMRFEDPTQVPIIMAPPFQKGDIKKWKLKFTLRKRQQDGWSGLLLVISIDSLQIAGADWEGQKVLKLEKGLYRIESVYAEYGNNCWNSGWVQIEPVHFFVGRFEKPEGILGDAIVEINYDYAFKSFKDEVVLPGQVSSLTGKTAQTKSFSFQWCVKNLGKLQSPATKISVQCEAKGKVPCPPEFPLTRPIPPIDPETSSGECVSIMTPASKEEATFQFLAKIDPDNAVKEKNEDNNSMSTTFHYTPPKVPIDEFLKEAASKLSTAQEGKGVAVKKVALVQLFPAKPVFTLGEKISLRSMVPSSQSGILEVEHQEGTAWRRISEPIVKSEKPLAGGEFKIIQFDITTRLLGKWRARSQITGGPTSNWAYFEVKGTEVKPPPDVSKSKPLSMEKKTQLTPPEILSPKPGQTFNAPAQVTVQVKGDTTAKLIFQLERLGGKAQTQTSSTGVFSNLEVGEYRVRAAYDLQGAPWSQWVNFTVKIKLPVQRMR